MYLQLKACALPGCPHFQSAWIQAAQWEIPWHSSPRRLILHWQLLRRNLFCSFSLSIQHNLFNAEATTKIKNNKLSWFCYSKTQCRNWRSWIMWSNFTCIYGSCKQRMSGLKKHSQILFPGVVSYFWMRCYLQHCFLQAPGGRSTSHRALGST